MPPPLSLSLCLSLFHPPQLYSASPASNWPGSTAGHAVLHGLDEVIISRPLTTSKINSFWNGHNGGLTCHDISIISSSPPLSSLSPLGTGRVWFIPGLMRGGNLGARSQRPTSLVLRHVPPNVWAVWSSEEGWYSDWFFNKLNHVIKIHFLHSIISFILFFHETLIIWVVLWKALGLIEILIKDKLFAIDAEALWPVINWCVPPNSWWSAAWKITEPGKLSLGGSWTSYYQMHSPLPSTTLFLPPLWAKYTSDVRVFYFYWMRAVCNAFTSVPASC